jgi:hypothetical protein
LSYALVIMELGGMVLCFGYHGVRWYGLMLWLWYSSDYAWSREDTRIVKHYHSTTFWVII